MRNSIKTGDHNQLKMETNKHNYIKFYDSMHFVSIVGSCCWKIVDSAQFFLEQMEHSRLDQTKNRSEVEK